MILYADTVTGSMQRAMNETKRRREIQLAYNKEHGIVPQTIVKTAEEIMQATFVADSGREKRRSPRRCSRARPTMRCWPTWSARWLRQPGTSSSRRRRRSEDRMEDVITMMAMEGKRPERPTISY